MQVRDIQADSSPCKDINGQHIHPVDVDESPLFINEENDQEDVTPDQDTIKEDEHEKDTSANRMSPAISHDSGLLSPHDDSSEKENINSRSKSDDSASTSAASPNSQDNSELQVIREQIKLIQQQHSYQLQMIHYLHWQINLISQQQGKSGTSPVATSTPSSVPDSTFTSFPQIINSNLSNIYSSDPAKLAASMAASLMKGNDQVDGNLKKFPPMSDRSTAAISPTGNPFAHEPFSSLENRKALISPPFDGSKIPTDNKMNPNGMFLQAFHQQQHRAHQEQLRQQQKPMMHHPNQLSSGLPPVPDLISAFRNNGGPGQFPNQDSRNSFLSNATLQPGANGLRDRSQFLSNAVSSAAEAHRLQQRLAESAKEPELVKNQCRTCRRILSCPSALKLHYRTHTGRKRFIVIFIS